MMRRKAKQRKDKPTKAGKKKRPSRASTDSGSPEGTPHASYAFTASKDCEPEPCIAGLGSDEAAPGLPERTETPEDFQAETLKSRLRLLVEPLSRLSVSVYDVPKRFSKFVSTRVTSTLNHLVNRAKRRAVLETSVSDTSIESAASAFAARRCEQRAASAEPPRTFSSPCHTAGIHHLTRSVSEAFEVAAAQHFGRPASVEVVRPFDKITALKTFARAAQPNVAGPTSPVAAEGAKPQGERNASPVAAKAVAPQAAHCRSPVAAELVQPHAARCESPITPSPIFAKVVRPPMRKSDSRTEQSTAQEDSSSQPADASNTSSGAQSVESTVDVAGFLTMFDTAAPGEQKPRVWRYRKRRDDHFVQPASSGTMMLVTAEIHQSATADGDRGKSIPPRRIRTASGCLIEDDEVPSTSGYRAPTKPSPSKYICDSEQPSTSGYRPPSKSAAEPQWPTSPGSHERSAPPSPVMSSGSRGSRSSTPSTDVKIHQLEKKPIYYHDNRSSYQIISEFIEEEIEAESLRVGPNVVCCVAYGVCDLLQRMYDAMKHACVNRMNKCTEVDTSDYVQYTGSPSFAPSTCMTLADFLVVLEHGDFKITSSDLNRITYETAVFNQSVCYMGPIKVHVRDDKSRRRTRSSHRAMHSDEENDDEPGPEPSP